MSQRCVGRASAFGRWFTHALCLARLVSAPATSRESIDVVAAVATAAAAMRAPNSFTVLAVLSALTALCSAQRVFGPPQQPQRQPQRQAQPGQQPQITLTLPSLGSQPPQSQAQQSQQPQQPQQQQPQQFPQQSQQSPQQPQQFPQQPQQQSSSSQQQQPQQSLGNGNLICSMCGLVVQGFAQQVNQSDVGGSAISRVCESFERLGGQSTQNNCLQILGTTAEQLKQQLSNGGNSSSICSSLGHC